MLYLLAVSPFCLFSIMSCCSNLITMVNEQQSKLQIYFSSCTIVCSSSLKRIKNQSIISFNSYLLIWVLTKTHNWVEWTAASDSLSQTKGNDINLNYRPQMQNDTGNKIGRSLFRILVKGVNNMVSIMSAVVLASTVINLVQEMWLVGDLIKHRAVLHHNTTQ